MKGGCRRAREQSPATRVTHAVCPPSARLRGEPARREGELVQLVFDCGDQPGMAIADVMHIVAVEIHVAPAGQILDPDALGLADRRQAGGRDRLVQEVARVFLEQRIARGMAMTRRPLGAPARSIDVALGLFGRVIPS